MSESDAGEQAVARRLRTAYETRDFGLLADLLDPHVRWGGEEETPDTCHSRGEVLAWYRGLYDRGVTATITEVTVEPGLIVFDLDVVWPGGEQQRSHQAFRLAGDRIVDIRDARIPGPSA